MYKPFRRVDEQHAVVVLRFPEHDDAGGDGSAEEQVRRQLNHCVDEVFLQQVFADFLFLAAAVEHTGKLDDGRGAVGRQPGEHVHGERQIGLRLRCKHAGRGESRIVDQCGVVVALPLGGVGRVGHDYLERFVIPVLWID